MRQWGAVRRSFGRVNHPEWMANEGLDPDNVDWAAIAKWMDAARWFPGDSHAQTFASCALN